MNVQDVCVGLRPHRHEQASEVREHICVSASCDSEDENILNVIKVTPSKQFKFHIFLFEIAFYLNPNSY